MTARQKRALVALLSAPTKREAAEIAGISYPTLRRWITQDADFRREYEAELAPPKPERECSTRSQRCAGSWRMTKRHRAREWLRRK